MASGKKAESGKHEQGVNGRRSSKRNKEGPIVMDTKAVFAAVYDVCEENAAFFSSSPKGAAGGAVRQLVDAMTTIQEHARSLEPVVSGFAAIYHHFDFDPHIPANGYRSLVKLVRCCLLHIVHKGRYISTSRRSIFFRVAHNASEMEAYSNALCQLRALLYLAQRLLHDNSHGNLFFQEESGLSQSFMREYASMHKGCFYGRCLGFQFTPAIRPYLQTMAIGLVAFSENYRKHQSGIGVAASSLFTSGKYAIDPELRGSEYERITQNLDVHFWKSFWNITETEILASLVSMTSVQVKVNRMLLVPPVAFDLPLAADPKRSVSITPPSAHIGPAPVQMRLISYELREGQDSEELLAISRSEGGGLSFGMKSKRSPPSPWLLVHYHGGGFVAQTSKSHEPYLKGWSQDLGVPILSVDYSLAPEAPFPRALEECFFAYCWALKNSHLLGWTGEKVCLAGDSAGGNLSITVSMRAASQGVRMPEGLVAAYPATLLTAYASPSRLLTLMDPLLPLSVLSRCLSAYAGSEPYAEKQVEKVSTLSMVRRDTALLLRDFKQGASNWIQSLLDHNRATTALWRLWMLLRRPLTLVMPSLHSPSSASCSEEVRKSVSEATLTSLHSDPPVPPNQSSEFSVRQESLKSHTCQDLGTHTTQLNSTQNAQLLSECTPEGVSFFLSKPMDASASSALSSVAIPPSTEDGTGDTREFPVGFEPLRSEQLAEMPTQTSPLVRNPYMSPLLAPDSMLKGLPPVHIVACALDPMLDDSVMFAKRLRGADQPVTLCIVDDLPHGFLSLSQLSRETREATNVCAERIREVFQGKDAAISDVNTHRKLERTGPGTHHHHHDGGGAADDHHGNTPRLFGSGVIPEQVDARTEEGAKVPVKEEEGLAGLVAANNPGDSREIGV